MNGVSRNIALHVRALWYSALLSNICSRCCSTASAMQSMASEGFDRLLFDRSTAHATCRFRASSPAAVK